MDSSSERSSAPDSQLLSRRTLVRAGATAAWAVPAIQVVAAAPAFAAGSGGPTTLTPATPTGKYTSSTALNVTASVTNSGTQSANNLQLTITLPTAATGTVTATGWTVTGSGTTFVFTADSPLVATASVGFDVTFAVTRNPAGSVSVIATADNAPQQTASNAVTGAASSTALQWDSVISGSYVASDATKLTVTTSVKNAGSAPANDFKIKVTLASVLTASAVTTPNGWSVSGSGTVWTFTRDTALPYDTSGGFTATFTVGSPAGGAITGEASASNVGAVATSNGNVVAGTSTLEISAVSGGYSTTDTSQLTLRGTVKNSGNIDTKGLKASFKISSNAGFDQQPSATPPVGWTTSSVTGSTAAGWTFTFTRSSQLAPGENDVLTTAVTTAGSTDVKKYAGAAFTETCSATADNSSNAPSVDASVGAAPDSKLHVINAGGLDGFDLASTGNKPKSNTFSARVKNDGPKVVGSIVMTVTCDRTMTAVNAVTASGWTMTNPNQTTLKFTYSGTLGLGALTPTSAGATFQTTGAPILSVTVSAANGQTVTTP